MSTYHKLVRDRVPDILEKKGVLFEKSIATDSEYKAELIKKLSEESAEFAENGDIEELADVIEVIAALQHLPEYAAVEAVRAKKYNERGGFTQRIILKGEKD